MCRHVGVCTVQSLQIKPKCGHEACAGMAAVGWLTCSRLMAPITFVVSMSWSLSGLTTRHLVAVVPVEDDHALSDFMTIKHD